MNSNKRMNKHISRSIQQCHYLFTLILIPKNSLDAAKLYKFAVASCSLYRRTKQLCCTVLERPDFSWYHKLYLPLIDRNFLVNPLSSDAGQESTIHHSE